MNKVYTLTQDCEYLRNKIIRLTLSAKGEGGNSIRNILKRITRETDKLSNDFDKVSSNYSTILNDYESTVKKLKEKEKLVAFLEKEVKRRTDEFDSMSRTFEDFITQRARQLRLERSDRLMRMLQQQRQNNETENITNLERSRKDVVRKKGTIKTVIPSTTSSNKHSIKSIDNSQERIELERGFEYLRRFKTLSKAFRHGEMMPTTNKNYSFSQETGPWTKTELYNRIIKPVNVHVPKIYDPNEQNSKDNISKLISNNIDEWYNNNDSDIIKASLYKPLDSQETTSFIKLYEKNTRKS